MTWTQVYVTGLSKSVEPSDDEIETRISERYGLADTAGGGGAVPSSWAGPGTTLVKRENNNSCRGYAFLSFHTTEGAADFVARVNEGHRYRRATTTAGTTPVVATSTEATAPWWWELRAEPSSNGGNNNNNNHKKKNKKKGKQQQQQQPRDMPDLRLRRKRGAPIRKHPVIRSSDGSRTNLGNKTR